MHSASRNLSYLLAVSGFIATVLGPDSPARAVWTLTETRAQREIAKWQDRPLIYNNDGADVLYGTEHTPQALLDVRTSGLADSQVSTINYCSRSSGFGLFTHNTQVGEVFTSTGGRYENNMTADLISQGTDCLEVMVDFARQNDMEIFWSMRMNDTHDAYNESAIYAFPQLKVDHPEWLLGSETDRPAYGAWTAIDYGVPEVRDLALAYFEEVCLNYDIDGIELDFFRHPYFFQSHADGGTATQADRDAMTQLVRNIRTMTEQISMQREKPILVGIRVPDSMDLCEDIGLDVTQWLDEGIVDLMAVSGYFRAEEWETSVALGHEYDVPVYACLSESRMSGEAGTVRNSQASYDARAGNVWASGADGVYMFNYFNDDSVLFDVVGDPETLRGRNKVYTTGARAVDSMSGALAGGLGYLNRDVVYPTRPSSFSPGQFRIIQMPVGDDIAGSLNEPGKTPLEARVQLRLYMDQTMDPADVLATINGRTLTGGTLEDGYIQYLVDPEWIDQGTNNFGVGVQSGASGGITLRDLRLYVTYKSETTVADPMLRERFAAADYTPGELIGQNPPGSSFDSAWSGGLHQSNGFRFVEDGLSHPDVAAGNGAVEFQIAQSDSQTHSIVRTFTRDPAEDDRQVYYLTGMMSFDESFSASGDATALTGLLNAEEGDDVPWTIGPQWGFQGNGSGVDAVFRARTNESPDYPIVTEVLASNIDSGTHLFVMKVIRDVSGSRDDVSVWFDPGDIWSEANAGSPDLAGGYACWLLPLSDPNRPIDTLVLSVTNAGDGTAVVFDEIRMGRCWDDLFERLEEDLEPVLAGDINGDGQVGSSDLDVVRANWGQAVTPGDIAAGDLTGDGAVGSADLDVIRANWGATSTAAVPEPGPWILLLALAGFALQRANARR